MGESLAKPGEPLVPTPVEGFDDYGHLPLDDSPNTRDLGGMPAKNGRRIARNRLVRSGAIHAMDEKDAIILLDNHQVRRVVDLRTPAEIKKEPAPYALLSVVELFEMPVLSDSAVGITHEQSLAEDAKALRRFGSDAHKGVRNIYPMCVLGENGMKAYSEFLELLLESDEGATLFHCTEGKDRAGLAAYLVEYALGVPEEVRMADYMATNLFVRTRFEKMMDSLGKHHVLEGADMDMDSIFYAYPDYLQAALDQIDNAFGSLSNYMVSALDFDTDKQRALQEKYLTPAC